MVLFPSGTLCSPMLYQASLSRQLPSIKSWNPVDDMAALREVTGVPSSSQPCSVCSFLSLFLSFALSSSARAAAESRTRSLMHGLVNRMLPSVLNGRAVSPSTPDRNARANHAHANRLQTLRSQRSYPILQVLSPPSPVVSRATSP